MKSNLFSILRRFTPADNRKLKVFLKGKYFTENKKEFQLFSELLRYYPLYDLSQDEKQRIYRKLYGECVYNDSTYRGIIHSLLASVEKFLVVKSIFKSDFKKLTLLIEELTRLNVPYVIEKKFRSSMPKPDTGKFSSAVLAERYDLGIMKYNFNKVNRRNVNIDDVLSQFGAVEDSNRLLSLRFFVEAVSNYVNMDTLNSKFNLKKNSQSEFVNLLNFERLGKIFENSQFEFVFELYNGLLQMHCNSDNFESFDRYLNCVNRYEDKLDKFELSQHYSYLISYCITSKNKPIGKILKYPLWDIYMKILKKELYSDDVNPYLDISLYRSVLLLGLELGKFSETRDFIDRYSVEVHPSEIYNITNLGNAYYFFEVKEYERSLEHSNRITNSEFVFKYDFRNLLVKIYYELGDFEGLESLLRSYQEFLRTDKLLNAGLRESITNFLSYTELLCRSFDFSDNVELEFTIKKLSEETKVFAKIWLLEKYSLLLSSRSANA